MKGRSLEHDFSLHLLYSGRLRLRQVLSYAAFVPSYCLRFGPALLKTNKAYLAGLNKLEVEGWARSFVDINFSQRIRESVSRRLDIHRQNGDELALLTGTPDFIAKPLAAKIGARYWRATQCRQRNGVFTAEPPSSHPFGQAKLSFARDICEEAGVELLDCIAYADAWGDAPLLDAVREPVAVSPDRRLAELARRKGWETLVDIGAADSRTSRLMTAR
jgi:phosphoserine phosphatase